MQCEYFALEGLSDLVNTIKRVYRNINPDLQFIGLLRVMYDRRVTLQQQVSEQIQTHFGDRVFKTAILRNVHLAEAPSHVVTGVKYDKYNCNNMASIKLDSVLLYRLCVQ